MILCLLKISQSHNRIFIIYFSDSRFILTVATLLVVLRSCDHSRAVLFSRVLFNASPVLDVSCALAFVTLGRVS